MTVADHRALPRAIVVMGVSGAGKTTLARALAERTGYRFIEGDALHPAGNLRKMTAGIPLDDGDRAPWLARIGDVLADAAMVDGGIASCSALRRHYRDRLRDRQPTPLVIIHPVMPREMLHARLCGRQDHFMPATLLDSQLATLEPLAPDEAGFDIDGSLTLDRQVALCLAGLEAFR